MEVFERNAPSKTRPGDRANLSQVRAYVKRVLDGVGAESILPEMSQDMLLNQNGSQGISF